MSKTKFSSPTEYLNSVSLNSTLSFVQVSLAAEYLGVTPSMVNDLVRNKSLDAVSVTGNTKSWKGILISSLIAYKTSRKEGTKNTTNKVKIILEDCARKGETISYSVLMDKVGMSSINPHHRRQIGEYLGEISSDSYKRDRFMLSALAVLKNTEIPNESFFGLAKDLNAMDEGDDENTFYKSQLTKIFKKHKTVYLSIAR
ncbi:MAG: hypothetical protein HGA96_08055 [Desulfobulbaceae bacterium]|nr:hypothetical protein [Desulfobulbaceae bacterium]